jgi:hypothetical protein
VPLRRLKIYACRAAVESTPAPNPQAALSLVAANLDKVQSIRVPK